MPSLRTLLPHRSMHSMLLLTITSAASAHTTLETVTMSEGVRVVNNVMIGHACGNGTSVIGTSVVFPDGKDSTILVDGKAWQGPLTDILSNWGPNIQPLVDRSVFNKIDEKSDANGNVVGFWAGGGEGMPNHMVGYVPFRVNATLFNAQSCATSVRFQVSIIDVCEITPETQLHSAGVAEFWTSNTLRTVYDNVDSDSSARLTITRNLATNPLPVACGNGSSVEVRISPAQLLRDMPIRLNGVQLWPK